MARYDKATEEFMSKLAGEQKPVEPADASGDEEKDLSLRPIRVLKSLSKLKVNPREGITKTLIRLTARNVMEKDSALKVLSLYQFMNDHYKRDWWDWEPETLWRSLEVDHLEGEGATPDEIKNAVMALQLCVNAMAPFEHWHIFEKVGHAFNWNPVSFAIVQPLEPDEAALAMAVLRKIQPRNTFEPEVLVYVAACAKSAGMVYLPDNMAPGVQEKLNDITFEIELRDATKKAWEDKELPKDGALRDQVEIQIQRLEDVKTLLVKENLYA
jgi:hypothetical protein